VAGSNRAPASDPMVGVNLKTYAVVQAADKVVIGPAAMAYKKSLPSPLRMGLHNFLFNMREPSVFVAFLVEHKIGKAFETLGRFTINTTIGVGGVFDIAKRKPFKLPWRPNGMADAMGLRDQAGALFLPAHGRPHHAARPDRHHDRPRGLPHALCQRIAHARLWPGGDGDRRAG
jgi:phospholipid-binding lipoprotein MlaA